jgi:drug/metabolite transporter (DMT)-like permease
MAWPQWLLAIGFALCVGGVMLATVTQGSPAGRYVMLSGLVPIAIGGLGALAQRLRTRPHH